MKNKITKETVPEGFTLGLALVDMLPVLLFSACAVVLGVKFRAPLFIIGAAVCALSGTVKVLWKIIAAVAGKNVWPMFIQMRIAMPAGFLLIVVSVILNHARISLPGLLAAATGFPQVIFFALGICGMILMSIFAVKLDSADPRANWTEQLTNAAAQLCFLIGILLI